jgi:hypothetical protein
MDRCLICRAKLRHVESVREERTPAGVPASAARLYRRVVEHDVLRCAGPAEHVFHGRGRKDLESGPSWGALWSPCGSP